MMNLSGNTKKNLAALVLLLVLCSVAGGCKRSNLADNFGGAIADWQAPDPAVGYNTEPSEIYKVDSPAFGEHTGFDVVAWPDNSALIPEQFFAIDGWFGQLEYRTPDDRLLVVRVALDGTQKLTSNYAERHNHNPETAEVDGVEVTQGESSEGCYAVTWVKGDFQYMIHSGSTQGAVPEAEIEALVSGLDAVQLNAVSSASSQ